MLVSLRTYTLTFSHKHTAHLHSTGGCPVPAEDSGETTSLLKEKLVEGGKKKVRKEKQKDQLIEKPHSSFYKINTVKCGKRLHHLSVSSHTPNCLATLMRAMKFSMCLSTSLLAVPYSNDLVDLPRTDLQRSWRVRQRMRNNAAERKRQRGVRK